MRIEAAENYGISTLGLAVFNHGQGKAVIHPGDDLFMSFDHGLQGNRCFLLFRLLLHSKLSRRLDLRFLKLGRLIGAGLWRTGLTSQRQEQKRDEGDGEET